MFFTFCFGNDLSTMPNVREEQVIGKDGILKEDSKYTVQSQTMWKKASLEMLLAIKRVLLV